MDDFERELVSKRSVLTRWAMRVHRDPDRAEDAVQETFTKAIANRHQFKPGTSLQAWLFVILRNDARLRGRREQRVVYTADPRYADSLVAADNQHKTLELKETLGFMQHLAPIHRSTLAHYALGSKLHETGEALGLDIGTVKSRVSRARKKLAIMMEAV